MTPEELADIKDIVKDFSNLNPAILSMFLDLTITEVERLWSMLPRTKDGVVAIPCASTLYVNYLDRVIVFEPEACEWHILSGRCRVVNSHTLEGEWIDKCYSTRQAAEEALKKEPTP